MATTTSSSSNLVPPSPPPRKETAAQHVERVKRERPSWSILDDIRRYAVEGFDSIPADDLAVRFARGACTRRAMALESGVRRSATS